MKMRQSDKVTVGLEIRGWRCLSELCLPKQRGLAPGVGNMEGWWALPGPSSLMTEPAAPERKARLLPAAFPSTLPRLLRCWSLFQALGDPIRSTCRWAPALRLPFPGRTLQPSDPCPVPTPKLSSRWGGPVQCHRGPALVRELACPPAAGNPPTAVAVPSLFCRVEFWRGLRYQHGSSPCRARSEAEPARDPRRFVLHLLAAGSRVAAVLRGLGWHGAFQWSQGWDHLPLSYTCR